MARSVDAVPSALDDAPGRVPLHTEARALPVHPRALERRPRIQIQLELRADTAARRPLALSLCLSLRAGVGRVRVTVFLRVLLLRWRQHQTSQSVHASPEPVAVEAPRGPAHEGAEPLPLSVHPLAYVATAAGFVNKTFSVELSVGPHAAHDGDAALVEQLAAAQGQAAVAAHLAGVKPSRRVEQGAVVGHGRHLLPRGQQRARHGTLRRGAVALPPAAVDHLARRRKQHAETVARVRRELALVHRAAAVLHRAQPVHPLGRPVAAIAQLRQLRLCGSGGGVGSGRRGRSRSRSRRRPHSSRRRLRIPRIGADALDDSLVEITAVLSFRLAHPPKPVQFSLTK